ncbi:Transposase DDE domain group 1 [Nitrosomonas halophila]|uniref:Transposase DDE domain group 1 n=2 Tax=Nitrosomonas halophila TaxID=44576 RepID=A0A1H3KE15_9PROT|nr:Transposase DDE domain group 1 [Nitrosomonas halophila]
MILDFDATDDVVYDKQEGRFFHGYYDHYCFLPLYVFCGDQLLDSYLRSSKQDAARHAWAILSLSGRYNQFRLLMSSLAYILLETIRRVALKDTELAQAYVNTLRLKLIRAYSEIQHPLLRSQVKIPL